MSPETEWPDDHPAIQEPTQAEKSGVARGRRGALDLLCELDGPEVARRRASSDADRTVRAWLPPTPRSPAPRPR